jgi:hypothetical protein
MTELPEIPRVRNVRRCANEENLPGYCFRWESPWFDETLEALKALVPYTRREWHPLSKEWWVARDVDLQPIFANWRGQVEAVECQGVLL